MPMTSEEMRKRAQSRVGYGRSDRGTVLGAEIQAQWRALADLTDEVKVLRKLVERHDHRVGSLDESPWYTSDPRFRDD
jgi:hypothetical protein